jgi:hypothetical protein
VSSFPPILVPPSWLQPGAKPVLQYLTQDLSCTTQYCKLHSVHGVLILLIKTFGTPTILRTTILRTTNLRTTNLRMTNLRRRLFSERPFSESDHSPNDQSPKTTNPWKTDYCQAVSKLLHILPDFLSLLHLIFHLYHRRQVHNCMDRIVIKSMVSAWFIVLGLG